MSEEKGITVDEFREIMRRIERDMLVNIGRAMAPEVNARLAKIKHANRAKPGPDDYCPGCGELSSSAPDLCPECLAVNSQR